MTPRSVMIVLCLAIQAFGIYGTIGLYNFVTNSLPNLYIDKAANSK